MISFDGTCPGGWLCWSWEAIANDMFDSVFYGALALPVVAWVIVRLIRRRRRLAKVE